MSGRYSGSAKRSIIKLAAEYDRLGAVYIHYWPENGSGWRHQDIVITEEMKQAKEAALAARRAFNRARGQPDDTFFG